jgi:L-rhamnose-H+ transport protein
MSMLAPLIGFCLLLLAGIFSASFTVPMKLNRQWAWENTWLAWSLQALVVLPLVVTLSTIPHLSQVYAEIGWTSLCTALALGVGWGAAQVMFGIAVDSIGIALAFSIVPGMSVAVGSLIPLFYLHADRLLSRSGALIILGVALAVCGVVVCAIAGSRREGIQKTVRTGRGFLSGLLIALFSGIGAAMVNLGLAFGSSLITVARVHGANPIWAPNVIWLPIMVSGSIPNIVYCLYLLRRNGTARLFREHRIGISLLRTSLMAGMWFASMILYGAVIGKLGGWGIVVAWPLFMTTIMITAGILGVVTGEWRHAGYRPVRIQMLGMACLITAIFVLWGASRLTS